MKNKIVYFSFFVFLFSAVGILPVQAKLIFSENWESYNVGQRNMFTYTRNWNGKDKWYIGQYKPNYYEIVDNPVRSGSKAIKMHNFYPATRNEIGPHLNIPNAGSGIALTIGQEYWMGFSMYIPKDYAYEKDHFAYEMHMQIHGAQDPGEVGRNPCMALYFRNNKIQITYRADLKKFSGTTSQEINYTRRGSYILSDPWTSDRGKWTDWVWHFKLSYNDDGWLKVYKNGKLVVDDKGANCFNDNQGPHIVIGTYKNGWKDRQDDTVDRIVYFDDFKLGDAGSSYEEVSPTNKNQGCTFYASPSVSLSSLLRKLKPGDVLCLRDGVYHDSLDIKMDGTSGKPITIKALHDGKAVIDGDFIKIPCYIHQSKYINVEGIVCRESSSSVFVINKASQFIQVKRVSAYDVKANNCNCHDFSVWNSQNVLLEDVVGSGRARTIFTVLSSKNVVIRRAYSLWKEEPVSNSSGVNNIVQIYGTSDSIVENSIGTVGPGVVKPVMGFGVWNNYYNTNPKASNNKIIGSVSFGLTHAGFFDSACRRVIENNLFDNDVSINNGYGMWQRGDKSEKLSHFTDIGGKIGHYMHGENSGQCKADAGFEVRSQENNCIYQGVTSVVYGIHRKVPTFLTESNSIFWQDKKIGSTINQKEVTNPEFRTNKWGYGAYLFPEGTRVISGGEYIGADVRYQYQNGTLTNQPLWPWSMEKRICDELGVSVTWEKSNQISIKTGKRCEGGLWKTLDGVYNNYHFFRGNSTWYEKIPANPAIMPHSNDYVNDVVRNSKMLTINYRGWSVPIWYAHKDTPYQKVEVNDHRAPTDDWYGVPIPKETKAASGGDAHMVVISYDRRYAWDFFHAKKYPDGHWSAKTLRRWDLSGDGINSPYDYYGSCRVAPVPLLHGLITYDEVVKQGHINHALAFAYWGERMPDSGVYPCEKFNTGVSRRRWALGIGFRLQLDPTLDINSLALNPAAKIIARALQEYGMIFVENNGVGYNSVYAEDLEHKSMSWSNIFNNSIASIPLNRFRVVEPIYPSSQPPLSCHCASWQDKECGGGGCLVNQIHQTRICFNHCDIESRCVDEQECKISVDINQDGETDIQDLGILLSNWGKTDKGRYDINQDGKTDSEDVSILFSGI